MRQRSILACLLLVAAGLQTAWAQEAMKVYSGGTFTVYRIENVEQVAFVKLVGEIQLSQTYAEIEKGETLQLTATVLPADADDRAVTWESSNTMAAKVDGNGLVTGVGRGTTYITCRAADGSDVYASCQVKANAVIVPGVHESVDLGLPSGTLWATMNLGADAPEEYGFYYAWGETEPKDDYTWVTYKWMTPGYSDWLGVSKYTFADGQSGGTAWYDNAENFIGDGLTELLPEDDAATVNWGAEWQMPSMEQYQELLDNTAAEWTQYNGVWGYVYTSSINGNSIFFPYAGKYDGEILGSAFAYWARETLTCADYGSKFEGSALSCQSRCYGMPIRPVRKQ